MLSAMQPRQVGDSREQAWNIGEIVLIVDENLPRGFSDEIIRVADVSTSGGILRRPAKKLVRLST